MKWTLHEHHSNLKAIMGRDIWWGRDISPAPNTCPNQEYAQTKNNYSAVTLCSHLSPRLCSLFSYRNCSLDHIIPVNFYLCHIYLFYICSEKRQSELWAVSSTWTPTRLSHTSWRSLFPGALEAGQLCLTAGAEPSVTVLTCWGTCLSNTAPFNTQGRIFTDRKAIESNLWLIRKEKGSDSIGFLVVLETSQPFWSTQLLLI